MIHLVVLRNFPIFFTNYFSLINNFSSSMSEPLGEPHPLTLSIVSPSPILALGTDRSTPGSNNEGDDQSNFERYSHHFHLWIHKWLKKRYHSYYWRHFGCWVLIAFIMSVPIHASGNGRLSYIDALFYTTSSITATGLTPTDFSREMMEPRFWYSFACSFQGR